VQDLVVFDGQAEWIVVMARKREVVDILRITKQLNIEAVVIENPITSKPNGSCSL
jgi:hypothetical protein